MTKYTSDIFTVNATQAQAYERLADLRRFEALKAAFSDPEKMQYILQNLPADQVSPEKLAKTPFLPTPRWVLFLWQL